MFKALFQVSPAAFVFLSGLMISVATSAAAQVAFAEQAASNRDQVVLSGVVAFAAGVCWFALSESLTSASRKVDAMSLPLNSRDAAIDAIPGSQKLAIILTFLAAAVLSGLWPWVGFLLNQVSAISCLIANRIGIQ
ncbi:MAG: hypothetical protein ACREDT_01470 [Methylocella sp.]